jgi:hypothetical protein
MEKEITFEIAGGLGNQLFMLSAAIYFKEKFNRDVTFEISNLEKISILHPGHNVYDLGLLDGYKVVRSKISNYGVFQKFQRLNRVMTRFGFNKDFSSTEIGFIDLAQISEDCNLVRGYFQSWRYFTAIADKPKLTNDSIPNPSDWYFKELEKLRKKEFAAFHIRRGDYRFSINRKQGILEKSYFEKIVHLVPKEIELIFFTDSPNEVATEFAQFNRKFRIIEPPASSDPVESLLLMSEASYLAISNSTYSWWAANFAKPESHIFVPSKWFEQGEDPLDLYPESWIRIHSEWEFQK